MVAKLISSVQDKEDEKQSQAFPAIYPSCATHTKSWPKPTISSDPTLPFLLQPQMENPGKLWVCVWGPPFSVFISSLIVCINWQLRPRVLFFCVWFRLHACISVLFLSVCVHVSWSRVCSYYCGGALMENLSSFPLCHSSSPPKGLKQRARRGRAEG